jgi:hypothetical protein
LVDFPIYDVINEIEKDNLLKGDLEENLRELEIFNDEESINYEKEEEIMVYNEEIDKSDNENEIV